MTYRKYITPSLCVTTKDYPKNSFNLTHTLIENIQNQINDINIRIDSLVPTPTPIPTNVDLNVFHIQEQWPTGTQGIAITGTQAQSRRFNTIITNTIDGIYMTGDQISIPAGRYYIDIRAAASKVDYHRLYLQSFSEGSILMVGAMEYAGQNTEVQTYAVVRGVLEFDHEFSFYTFHHVSASGILGVSTTTWRNFPETYAEMFVWQLPQSTA